MSSAPSTAAQADDAPKGGLRGPASSQLPAAAAPSTRRTEGPASDGRRGVDGAAVRPVSASATPDELQGALSALRERQRSLEARETRMEALLADASKAAPRRMESLRGMLKIVEEREKPSDKASDCASTEPSHSPALTGRAGRKTLKRAVGTIINVARLTQAPKPDLTAIERELQRKKAEQESTRWMIDPEGRERALWDSTAACFVFYASVLLPFRLGFHCPVGTGFQVLDVLADLSRFVDIGVNFRTGFMDSEQHLVLAPSLVRAEYLHSWFALDLLLSVPFLLLGDLSRLGGSARTAFYALAMLRIFPTARRAQLVARLGAVVDVTVARILVLFATFMYLMHIMACSYWAVVRHQEDEEDDAWLPRRALLTDEATDSDRYSQALYWALLVTVNGFITKAFNREEAEFTAAMYVLGSFTYATIIASTTSLVANLDATAVAKRDHTARLNAKMQYNKIHPALQDDIREYYEYCWAVGTQTEDEGLFEVLPESLHRKLTAFLAMSFVEHCSFFDNFSSKALVAVLDRVEPCIFLTGDEIIREGDEGADMYFIKRGDVRLHLRSGAEIGTLVAGDFFGEACVLHENVARTASCTADTIVECLCLTREAFAAVVEEFPEVQTELQSIADQRLKQHSNVRKLDKSGKLGQQRSSRRKTRYETAIEAEDPGFAEVVEAADRLAMAASTTALPKPKPLRPDILDDLPDVLEEEPSSSSSPPSVAVPGSDSDMDAMMDAILHSARSTPKVSRRPRRGGSGGSTPKSGPPTPLAARRAVFGSVLQVGGGGGGGGDEIDGLLEAAMALRHSRPSSRAGTEEAPSVTRRVRKSPKSHSPKSTSATPKLRGRTPRAEPRRVRGASVSVFSSADDSADDLAQLMEAARALSGSQ